MYSRTLDSVGLKLEQDDALRGTLGNTLRRHIDASMDAVAPLMDRWDKNEALYNQDPDESSLNIVDGLQVYPIPLWPQKADRIVGTVYQGITGVEPYVQILTDDGTNERADNIEQALMVLANRGATSETFDRAFLQDLQLAINTNLAALYAYKKPDGFVCFKAIHPKDFCAYPHEVVDIKKMVTTGHRFYKMRSDVQASIDSGDYFNAALGSNADTVGAETGKGADFAKVQATGTTDISDELLTLYQLIHRGVLEEGGDPVTMRITYCYDSQEVLSAEEYPYENYWYFPIRFTDEYNSFWPSNSPGWKMQALQKAYTDICNVIIGGAYATAFPILIFEQGAMPTKMKRTTVGAIYEVPAGTKVTQIKPEADFSHLMSMLQVLDNAADGVTRISTLGTSQNMPSGTTATAAAGFLKAQEEGKDQYTAFVAPVVADIWRFLFELLVKHFDEFKELHGPSLPIESVEELQGAPLRFEPTGKSAETNPAILLQKLQMLLGMSGQPASQLDYAKVEDQVVQSMNIPQDLKSLQKDVVSVAEQLMAALMENGVPPEGILQALMQMNMEMEAANAIANAGGGPAVQGDGNPPTDPGMASGEAGADQGFGG